jgi:hypothetical protein
MQEYSVVVTRVRSRIATRCGAVDPSFSEKNERSCDNQGRKRTGITPAVRAIQVTRATEHFSGLWVSGLERMAGTPWRTAKDNFSAHDVARHHDRWTGRMTDPSGIPICCINVFPISPRQL